MKFVKTHTDPNSLARCGVITTDHGQIETPIFMPVGTVGSVKGIYHKDLKDDIKAEIILGNTYHLYLRPGLDVIKAAGGLHKFESWDRPILTDSGGFQVFSLSPIRKLTEDGCVFRSHIDGSKHTFTPENNVDTQRIIGADIIMALDECTPGDATHSYALNSLKLTQRWLERCIKRFDSTDPLYGYKQFFFPIIQGCVYPDLRRMAAEQDSLYTQTYNAYSQNQFDIVKPNKAYALENYPLSPLMPRFLFLNAIAVAKTEGQEAFVIQLQDMVTRYPDSELASMAKDMLALMGQGAESQMDGTMASLQDRRQEEQLLTEEAEDTTVTFSHERREPSFVVLVMPRDEQRLNTLLYEVALYNFSQFMIKDFDLKQILMFGVGDCALQIAGFDSLDDAMWYEGMLKKNMDLMQVLQANEAQIITITQSNFDLIGKHFTLEEYLEWAK